MRRLLALTLVAGCTVDGWSYRPRDAGADRATGDASVDATPDATPDATSDADDADAPLADTPEAAVDVEAPPPRLVWPLSGSRLTGRSPTLRWTAREPRVTVERCADRACAQVVESVEVTGATLSLRDVAPGPHWWRVRAGSRATPAWLFFAARQSPTVTRVAGVVPDFDADGLPDLAVGASNYERDGAVLVYPGARGGGASTAAVTLRSPDPQAQFGERLSCGDVNGDGFVDLAVGARFAGDAGAVFVFRGGPRGLEPDAPQRLSAPPRTMEFGWSLSAQGDLDGDGFADLVAMGYLGLVARVGRGSAAAVRWGDDASLAVTGVGACASGFLIFDGDDDGRDDVGCFEHGSASARAGPLLRWFRGSPLAQGPSARAPFHAESTAVLDAVVAGDLDGDGRAELVVTTEGTLSVVPLGVGGPEEARATVHTGEAATWGRNIAAGDFDGDGRADLLVATTSAPGSNPRPATLCLSRRGGCAGVSTLRSTVEGPYSFGVAVSLLDLDGDGFDDAVVGGERFTEAVRSHVEVFAGRAEGVGGAPVRALVDPWRLPSQFGESFPR